MHDLDRNLFEVGESAVAGEAYEAYETPELQEMQELLAGEVAGESYEAYETPELQEMQELLAGEVVGESYEAYETPELQEVQELDLASELLATSSEAELEQFLGNLLNRAVTTARNFAASDTGRALGGVLKQAAKRALPIVGRAAGSLISPQAGDIGARVATRAGTLFGLELEGLSQEDREFELARAFVRFADAATKKAASAAPTVSPQQAVRAAVTSAARAHAPGLVAALTGPLAQRGAAASPPGSATTRAGGAPQGVGASGRWVRRGNTVVLFGL